MATPINTPADHKGDALKILYKRHAQGAIVRSVASIVMWISSLIAYLITLISIDNFISNSVAVLYLILMNPLVLWVLKRIERRRLAAPFSILINLLEIVGYTAVIHAFGGIEATYLIPIYAAVIVYMGVMGTRIMPFIVAALCSSSFGVMLTLEHVGILRTLKINPSFTIPWLSQLGILFVDTILLFVVAFISSYTAQLLKRNRDRLVRQNEELQRAIAKAQEGDRLKSEFLANVSHELRTPLNAIIGFSELLKDQYLGELNEKQRESTSAIHASGRHLLSIVSDLLDLGRVEAGKMDLQLSGTDLKMLVENSINMVRRLAEERGIHLTLDICECPEMIRADERKIRQIIYNLLSNAIKFSSDGGEVTLSARDLHWVNDQWITKNGVAVSIPLHHGNEDMSLRRIVHISVTDTGIGLKEEDFERIFDPFVQVDGSISRRYQGAGLGLALTKHLVELHNGAVWACSEGERRGSTFHFVIPV